MANRAMALKVERARKQHSQACKELAYADLCRSIDNPRPTFPAIPQDHHVQRLPCAGLKPLRHKTFGDGTRTWSGVQTAQVFECRLLRRGRVVKS